MAVPTFLASSHRYSLIEGITDVDDIITEVRSECVTYGSPAWTEPSTALFKTPVDSDGRWIDILLTRISATQLEMRVRDKNAVTICTRRMNIDGGGTNIQIMSGEWHLVINSLMGTPESLRAFMLDLSPEAQDAHVGYPIAYGSRNSSGSLDNDYPDAWYAWNFNTSAYALMWALQTFGERYGATIYAVRQTGAYMFFPVYFYGQHNSTDQWQFGRFPQVYFGANTLNSMGALYDVPIDSAITAKFTRLGTGAFGNLALFIRAD